MDKTVKQLADEYKISKQAINYHIKKLSKDTIKFDSKGTKLINEKGQEMLSKMLSKGVSKGVSKEISNFDSKDLIYDTLVKQLEEKDKQIAELHEMLSNSQKLQALAEQKLQLLENKDEKQKKKWFWQKKDPG